MYGLLIFGLVTLLVYEVSLLENGLARTPPMGWMSWGYYECADRCDKNPDKCLDEKLILSVTDSFYEEGYQEAGFEYIIIDDCWSERLRDVDGKLVPDRKRFPRGMRFIADYIHARGLKFGMYTNIAQDTCMRYPGSKGFFDIDAATFAEWGADYIKVDGCFVTEDYLDKAYIKLGHHLNETGRPMVYTCSWPYYKVYIHNNTPDYSQIAPLCNMWRNYHDVAKAWGSVKYIINHFEVMSHYYSQFHGPGHWNDPDMLLFGTGILTPSQARIQLAVYAMLSAPLLISCPMKKISPNEKSYLLNMELIAIGQDALGIMATPYKLVKDKFKQVPPLPLEKIRDTDHYSHDLTLWVKRRLPAKGGIFHTYSFAFVNFADTAKYVRVAPQQFGLDCTNGYTVSDVFKQNLLKNVTLQDTIELIVPAEDVLLYSFYPL